LLNIGVTVGTGTRSCCAGLRDEQAWQTLMDVHDVHNVHRSPAEPGGRVNIVKVVNVIPGLQMTLRQVTPDRDE
jgi:hypothetical protein